MPSSRRQTGAALAVALVLLVVLTLLAVSGMGMATAELAMAGNEQLRRRASDAASAALERALADPTRAEWRYVGDEAVLPRFSAEKFVGRHYVIERVAEAPRGARDVQVQGVLVISPKGADP
jgi:Tfp pilus assembly protein PilX